MMKLRKWKKIIKESGLFSFKYYLFTYPDIRHSGIDPIMHYIKYGVDEGRNPSNEFNTSFYLKQYKDVQESGINPLVHYILYGKEERRKCMEALEKNIEVIDKDYFNELFHNNNNCTLDYSNFKEHAPINTDLKLIAFYLPQFHPIEQNDKAWGKGFTEWTNVSKALPQYEGHYQPKLPGELGFYDLRLIDIQKRQIELAKNYGLHGFCYHYYWFDGKKILDRPLQQILDNPALDFPFCINWANENWTKCWDGLDQDIIFKQNHTPEDDIAFLEAIKPILCDKRYIKINDKALLMIYRPQLFPNIKETVKRWRKHARKIGVGELYLVLTHSFDFQDPREIGFDAATEFPPNNFHPIDITEKINSYNPDFQGKVFDFDSIIAFSKNHKEPDYIKFRGITPSWDNEARRPGKGANFLNSSPDKFGNWLDYLIDYTDLHRTKDEKIIFVNAWNEWAEGAYLEPDRRLGYAYLDHLYKSLLHHKQKHRTNKIIFVSHDAHFHGAQVLALNIIKSLHQSFNFDVHMIIKSGGKLESEFEKYATVYNLEKNYLSETCKKNLITNLKEKQITHAICNTVVSGDILNLLNQKNITTISLIHELPDLIKKYKMEENASLITKHAKKIIFPSNFVKDKFNSIAELNQNSGTVLPQGLFKKNTFHNDVESARIILREELNLANDAIIILGVGFADHRKGIDLFVSVAQSVCKDLSNAYFIWIGDFDPEMKKYIHTNFDIDTGNLIFIPAQPEISLYYAGSDLYLMTSREDPFPSVVLDTMNIGVPVIGFQDAGGFQDIVTEDTGILVPFENTTLMTNAVINLLNNNEKRNKLGINSSKLINEKFAWKNYIYKLLDFVDFSFKKVSVIVPNYNYAHYLIERINSIKSQTYPIWELIILDDASTDESIYILDNILAELDIDCQLIKNNQNSGSVFEQWYKGISLSTGDYVWIAEADDLSEANFLERVMHPFDSEHVVLSYCDSTQMSSSGVTLDNNYQAYTSDISKSKWKQNYIVNGIDEIKNNLAIKNTIPNVSGVVFKRKILQSVLDEHIDEIKSFRVAGDWLTYIYTLINGKVAFTSEPLNHHRRHENSVTINSFDITQLKEILTVQKMVRDQFSPDENSIKKAQSYSSSLYNQFGLSSQSNMKFYEHPELKDFLRDTV